MAVSDGSATACDPLRLSLKVAQASDVLARLHRGIAASETQVLPESGTPKSSQVAASSSCAGPRTGVERQRQISELAERVAAAAESLEQSQRKAALLAQSKKSATSLEKQAAENDAQNLVTAAPETLRFASYVAKEARRAADRQARRMVVPQACEVKILDPEWMQHQLRKIFLGDSDLHQACLASGGHRLSLTCPLSGEMLRVPVRGVDCQHIECFDLESFRQSTSGGWKCPMVGCGASAAPDMLRRDSFVEAILSLISSSQRTVALGLELSDIKTRGTVAERAKLLAQHALACHAVVPALSKPCTSLIHLVKSSVPIEIEDDSDEERPKSKRRCRLQRGCSSSSIGGA